MESGFYQTKLLNNIVCCGCGWQSGEKRLSLKHINCLHKVLNIESVQSKNIAKI